MRSNWQTNFTNFCSLNPSPESHDQEVQFIRYLRILRTNWKPNVTNISCPKTSLESNLTKKYIFKVIQSYSEANESQHLQFFTVPTIHWGQIRPEKTF